MAARKPVFEYSAGGVVFNNGQCLMIRARNLQGRAVWTFPKGHVDQRETSEQAALREVEEETGWRCRIEGELPRSEYWFQRAGQRIKKTVRWFYMSPIEKCREPDEEVEEVAWVPLSEVSGRLTYPKDRITLEAALRFREHHHLEAQ
ncbi:MAG: NUDIX hydrolase [Nitrospirae bacterium]|nr:MAG: NUDIX hydrolase [Nitrospirota bacterium]